MINHFVVIKPDLLVAPIIIIGNQIAVASTSLVFFSVFTIIQQEGLMGWHLSGVTRTRIRVTGVIFSEVLSQENERRYSCESNLILSQWGIRVSEFELTK